MDECKIYFMGLLLYYMLRWYEPVYPCAVGMALHLYDARLMRLEQRIDVLPPLISGFRCPPNQITSIWSPLFEVQPID